MAVRHGHRGAGPVAQAQLSWIVRHRVQVFCPAPQGKLTSDNRDSPAKLRNRRRRRSEPNRGNRAALTVVNGRCDCWRPGPGLAKGAPGPAGYGAEWGDRRHRKAPQLIAARAQERAEVRWFAGQPLSAVRIWASLGWTTNRGPSFRGATRSGAHDEADLGWRGRPLARLAVPGCRVGRAAAYRLPRCRRHLFGRVRLRAGGPGHVHGRAGGGSPSRSRTPTPCSSARCT